MVTIIKKSISLNTETKIRNEVINLIKKGVKIRKKAIRVNTVTRIVTKIGTSTVVVALLRINIVAAAVARIKREAGIRIEKRRKTKIETRKRIKKVVVLHLIKTKNIKVRAAQVVIKKRRRREVKTKIITSLAQVLKINITVVQKIKKRIAAKTKNETSIKNGIVHHKVLGIKREALKIKKKSIPRKRIKAYWTRIKINLLKKTKRNIVPLKKKRISIDMIRTGIGIDMIKKNLNIVMKKRRKKK